MIYTVVWLRSYSRQSTYILINKFLSSLLVLRMRKKAVANWTAPRPVSILLALESRQKSFYQYLS